MKRQLKKVIILKITKWLKITALKLTFPSLKIEPDADIISIPKIVNDNTSSIFLESKVRCNKMTTICALCSSKIKISSVTTLACKERMEGSMVKSKNFGTILIGKECRIDHNVRLSAEQGKIIIGDNVTIGANTIITSHDVITIGRNTQIASGCVILDHDHNWNKHGICDGFSVSQIQIGENVWIGVNSVVLKGTSIGSNTIIGAATICKGDIPSYCKIFQKRETQIEPLD